MILEVLISTIDEGIEHIPMMLLSPRDDVRYLISWQRSRTSSTVQGVQVVQEVQKIQKIQTGRQDVKVFMMDGKGLSRNRNNALLHATGDILLLADDDCRYTDEYFDNILNTYAEHPEADIILFKAKDFPKSYPAQVMPLKKAMHHRGYYPSSWEITLRDERRKTKDERQKDERLKFNEHFGLGSDIYPCGEEDLFLCDAQKGGMNVLFVPKEIVETPVCTTGSLFLLSPDVRRAKGAVFRYCYPRLEAEYRLVKECLHHWIYNHMNPFKLYREMCL